MTLFYAFTAPLWEWEGKAAWFFVTVPVEISNEIDARTELVELPGERSRPARQRGPG